MGTLYYGTAVNPIPLEDRALAHLRVVIATKLRRNESFTVSWQHSGDEPEGRSTIWLHPAIPLRFDFDASEAPALKPEWIQAMANSVNSTGGIQLVEEVGD